jgi:hypothetical protein
MSSVRAVGGMDGIHFLGQDSNSSFLGIVLHNPCAPHRIGHFPREFMSQILRLNLEESLFAKLPLRLLLAKQLLLTGHYTHHGLALGT